MFIITIETLILVAVWNHKPFILQGSFNIINKKDNSIKLLFFRCECDLKDKINIYDEFSPYDYKFTQLFTDQSTIDLKNHNLEPALYLLKYSLKTTLEKMLERSNKSLISIDEIAMSSLSKQAENYVISRGKQTLQEICFSVSIVFKPTEHDAKLAADSLVGIDRYSKNDNLIH